MLDRLRQERILRCAIKKATDNGWECSHADEDVDQYIMSYLLDCGLYIAMLFDFDFAKAFWGDGWKEHLQILVLVDDKLSYIEEYGL